MQIQIHGYYDVTFKNGVCEGAIELYPSDDYALIKLHDGRRGESFAITADLRYKATIKKLNELINHGVISDTDAEFLRLLENVKSPKTRTKYFEKFAEGQLEIEELRKVVKLSTSRKFNSEILDEMRERVFKYYLIRVCQIPNSIRWWTKTNVYYVKAHELQLVLFATFHGQSLDDFDGLSDVIAIGEFGATHLDLSEEHRRVSKYVEYAVYKYILEGKNLDNWLKRGDQDFSAVLSRLNNNNIEIYNVELYDYIKSLLVLTIV